MWYYRFDGYSWNNFNVLAYLYTSLGQDILGRQYWSAWEVFMPLSRVIVNVVSTISVDSNSIAWTNMDAICNDGEE